MVEVNIQEHAAQYHMSVSTVRSHMRQGFCAWPRRQKTGHSKDPAYRCWDNMIQRCTNPKKNGYHNYGGRGIQVCREWRESFLAFLQDVGPRPGKEYSIDRIDPNGNYEPGNVRWATGSEQMQNLRGGRGSVYKRKDGWWQAQITEDNRNIYLGIAKNKDEAQAFLSNYLREDG